MLSMPLSWHCEPQAITEAPWTHFSVEADNKECATDTFSEDDVTEYIAANMNEL